MGWKGNITPSMDALGSSMGTSWGGALGTSIEEVEDIVTVGAKKAFQSPMRLVMEDVTADTKTTFNKDIASTLTLADTSIAEKMLSITTGIAEKWFGMSENTVLTWDTLKLYFDELFLLLIEQVTLTWTTITETITGESEVQYDVLETSWTAINEFLVEGWELLGSTVDEVWTVMSETIMTITDELKVWLHDTWDAIKVDTLELFEEMNIGIEIKLWELYDLIDEIFDEIKENISQTALREIGENMINGMIEGIHNRAEHLVSATRSAINAAIQSGNDLLGNSSPSKVMEQMFEYAMRGGEIGIEKNENNLVTSMSAAVAQSVLAAQRIVSTAGVGMGGMAGGPVYNNSSSMSVDRSRNISVEMNPTYQGSRDPSDIRFDIEAALAGAFL